MQDLDIELIGEACAHGQPEEPPGARQDQHRGSGGEMGEDDVCGEPSGEPGLDLQRRSIAVGWQGSRVGQRSSTAAVRLCGSRAIATMC